MWAHLRGNNQGLAKLPAGAVKRPDVRGAIKVREQSQVVEIWDGNQNYGMVVLQKAVQEAIKICQNHGVAAIGTNNTSTSTGALGYGLNSFPNFYPEIYTDSNH